MHSPDVFVVGGAVQAGGGLYITRRADEELLRLCRDGAFSYVLYARQVGKSSLIINVAERLRGFDVLPVFIDLTQIGTSVSAEEWYLGHLSFVEDQLDLETDLVEWWRASPTIGPPQRMINFFREVLLREIKKRVVIFVDEIDTTLGLPFADDYFAAIRAIYNARAIAPELNRLSFVLTGVATPSELIRDVRRTPFNIAEIVNLDDFTMEEAMPLSGGLGLRPDDARQVLMWVLNWSGGHPYLTLRICSAVVNQGKQSWTEKEIDSLVKNLFLETGIARDNNLLFIQDMLTKRLPPEPEGHNVLLIYKDILLGRLATDDRNSAAKSHLKLSGVVKSQGGLLHIRNPIYREVFNEQWVSEHLPAHTRKISKWLRSWMDIGK